MADLVETKEQKKKKKKRNKFYRVKKNRYFFSVVFFLVIVCVVAVIGVLFVDILFTNELENKINSEARQSYALLDMFKDSETNVGGGFALIDKYMDDFIVYDSNGELKYVSGENTCSDQSTEYLFVVYNNGAKGELVNNHIYEDINTVYFDIEDEGYNFDIPKILESVRGQFKYASRNPSENAEVLDKSFMTFPLWMDYVDADTGEVIVFKIEVHLYLNDLAMVVLLIMLVGIVILIVFVYIVVNTVRKIINQRKMTQLCFKDFVTGGHNKIYFYTYGEKLISKVKNKSKKFAVVDLQFVNYLRYCVCHSITEGEKMCCAVHSIIKSNMDKREILSYCSDGNFALLLCFADREELNMRVNDIVSELEKELSYSNAAFHAGVRILENEGGMTGYRNIDIELEYNNASTARARLEGKDGSGVVYFDEELVAEQKWENTVNEMQQKAIDNEEFVVYYQPKYDPNTNELKGAEALVRWQSPDYGFITPNRFIPVFEKNGFITRLDHYMICHVARDQRRWKEMGYECVPVSVNVSRAHFIESDLAEQIKEMVDSEGTEHKYIEIELTESAFFDDKKAIIDTVTRLKEYGFSVSMDDFGSGYSSLNSLKDMPLDVLKLDAEFFRGESADTKRAEIVVAEAIRLAKSLNMRTVAEGVEGKEQVDFLAGLECDMIQGYYYSKPVPAGEYEGRMKKTGQVNADEGAGAEQDPDKKGLQIQDS